LAAYETAIVKNPVPATTYVKVAAVTVCVPKLAEFAMLYGPFAV
jgi:hypothetical protein